MSLDDVSGYNVVLVCIGLKTHKAAILSKYVDNLKKASSLIEKDGSKYKVNPNIDNFIRSLEEENAELRHKLEKFKEKDKEAIAEIEEEIKVLDKDKGAIEQSVTKEAEKYDERIKENEEKILDLNKQISPDEGFYSFLSDMTTFLDGKYCYDSNDLSQNVRKRNAVIRGSLKLTEEAREKNIKEHISFLKSEIELWNKQKVEILTQQNQLLENIELLKQSLVEQIKQHEQNMARFSLPDMPK